MLRHAHGRLGTSQILHRIRTHSGHKWVKRRFENSPWAPSAPPHTKYFNDGSLRLTYVVNNKAAVEFSVSRQARRGWRREVSKPHTHLSHILARFSFCHFRLQNISRYSGLVSLRNVSLFQFDFNAILQMELDNW